VEVGCLRHPETCTIGSLLKDEDCTDGWQTVESAGEGGGGTASIQSAPSSHHTNK